MAEALDKEMNGYFTQLNDAEKESVIQMLKSFLKGRKSATDRISIDQYNLELREAEEEYERGEYITHDEFISQMKKWWNIVS